MLKYTDTMVTFSEVPDEISLCVNISNCPIHCPGCHSKELWKDVGKELTYSEIDQLMNRNDGCTVFTIMGGDANPKEVNDIAEYVGLHYDIKVCWYSGQETLSPDIDLHWFDYVKLGPYIEEKGGLNEPTTNQRFYEVVPTHSMDEKGNIIMELKDITNKFWKKK